MHGFQHHSSGGIILPLQGHFHGVLVLTVFACQQSTVASLQGLLGERSESFLCSVVEGIFAKPNTLPGIEVRMHFFKECKNDLFISCAVLC